MLFACTEKVFNILKFLLCTNQKKTILMKNNTSKPVTGLEIYINILYVTILFFFQKRIYYKNKTNDNNKIITKHQGLYS